MLTVQAASERDCTGKQCCALQSGLSLNGPKVMILNASEKFDSEGNLAQVYRGKIVEVAAALTSWRVRYQTMAMQQFWAACTPDFQ